MRVFLDTNVVIAAVAARGLCADVMREVLARHELIISESLLEEINTVLTGKFGVPGALIGDLESLLRDGETAYIPSFEEDPPVRDPADRILVAAALAGEAEVFVTGDAELLALQTIDELAIISPREFWERVKSSLNR